MEAIKSIEIISVISGDMRDGAMYSSGDNSDRGGYKLLEDYTADIGFIAYGETLEEVFINSVRAMTDIQIDYKSLNPELCKDILVEGTDLLELVRNWLEELLYWRDTEQIFFCCVSNIIITYNSRADPKWRIEAKLCGEKFNERKHTPKIEIKAVSYHHMEFCQREFEYSVRVLVDI